jgi:hypothetical protein
MQAGEGGIWAADTMGLNVSVLNLRLHGGRYQLQLVPVNTPLRKESSLSPVQWANVSGPAARGQMMLQ